MFLSLCGYRFAVEVVLSFSIRSVGKKGISRGNIGIKVLLFPVESALAKLQLLDSCGYFALFFERCCREGLNIRREAVLPCG